MVDDLLSASNTKFKIGDNLLIIQTNVSDYWISSIGNKTASIVEKTVSGTTGSDPTDLSGTGENIYYPGTIDTTIETGYSQVVVKSVSPLTASATISSYNSSTGAIKLRIKSILKNTQVTVKLNCTTKENVAEYGYYNISNIEDGNGKTFNYSDYKNTFKSINDKKIIKKDTFHTILIQGNMQ